MLPHRCWNTWRNSRTVIARTDIGSLDQLIVTHLVKNFAWILWTPNVHYHNCNSLLVIPIHSQPNQASTFRLYLFIIHYLLYAYAEVFQVTSFVQFLYLKFHIHLLLSCVYCTSQPSCNQHDFRLLLWCKWYCCSSGVLRSVEWQLVSYVSAQSIGPICKAQEV
jgi:hypothetical protein